MHLFRFGKQKRTWEGSMRGSATLYYGALFPRDRELGKKGKATEIRKSYRGNRLKIPYRTSYTK